MNSFTLSWPQPEQPNGIILDYELRYYEKVRPATSARPLTKRRQRQVLHAYMRQRPRLQDNRCILLPPNDM